MFLSQNRWGTLKMKTILTTIAFLFIVSGLSSQETINQEIFGTWKEGRSLLNGCADTSSQFAKYQTGESGRIWKFSHKNDCTTWDFGPKGKYNRKQNSYEIIKTDSNIILRFNNNPSSDLNIIRLTKKELWVETPFDVGKYRTFYRNEK